MINPIILDDEIVQVEVGLIVHIKKSDVIEMGKYVDLIANLSTINSAGPSTTGIAV